MDGNRVMVGEGLKKENLKKNHGGSCLGYLKKNKKSSGLGVLKG